MGKYTELLKRARESVEYWTQIAMRRIVGDAVRRMSEKQISRAELAEKMGVSPAYVTKILRGDVNFTLESMVKLARALGGELQIGIVDSASCARVANVPIAVSTATKADPSQPVKLSLAFGGWVKAPSSNDACYKVAA